jgi:hypothetical protein
MHAAPLGRVKASFLQLSSAFGTWLRSLCVQLPGIWRLCVDNSATDSSACVLVHCSRKLIGCQSFSKAFIAGAGKIPDGDVNSCR